MLFHHQNANNDKILSDSFSSVMPLMVARIAFSFLCLLTLASFDSSPALAESFCVEFRFQLKMTLVTGFQLMFHAGYMVFSTEFL